MNNDVTVFVIACDNGDPNRELCLNALRPQSDKIEVIHNVAPMSAAFQQMLDRCETPLFIQVDQDMVLVPGAVEKMVKTINAQPRNIAFVVFLLQDVHLNMAIQGVKIYRRDIMRKFPYNLATISCEKNQMDRLKEGGYTVHAVNEVLGMHSPSWTPELIFERYFDLMQKWWVYGYSWLEDMPRKLLAIWQKNQTDTNLYAYLGAVAGSAAPKLRTREKDYRMRTLEYLKAKAWHSQPTGATIFLTGRCNLRCRWCMRQGDMPPPQSPDFDPWIVDELMIRFPTIKGICICGFGEPLLHPNFPNVMEHIRKHRGVVANLITNGTLLGGQLPMLLANRPDSISVSLNAATAAEHAKETGCTDMFSHVLYGIRMAANAGIPMYLSRVCHAQNLRQVPKFLDLAADLNVRGVDLHNLLPHDVETPEKLKAFLNSVLTVKHKDAVEKLKEHEHRKLVRSWPVLIDPEHPVRRCDCAFNTIAVDGNRYFSLCQSVYPPHPDNGGIRDPRCWHNEYAEAFRARFAQEEIEPACRYCFRNYQ